MTLLWSPPAKKKSLWCCCVQNMCWNYEKEKVKIQHNSSAHNAAQEMRWLWTLDYKCLKVHVWQWHVLSRYTLSGFSKFLINSQLWHHDHVYELQQHTERKTAYRHHMNIELVAGCVVNVRRSCRPHEENPEAKKIITRHLRYNLKTGVDQQINHLFFINGC